MCSAIRNSWRARAKLLGLDVPVATVDAPKAAETFQTALPVVSIDRSITAQPGRPDASSAPAAIEAIRRGVADVLRGAATAVVTNPIAKNVLYQSGFQEPGHTEYLATLVAEMNGLAVQPVMLLWSPGTCGGSRHHPPAAEGGPRAR